MIFCITHCSLYHWREQPHWGDYKYLRLLGYKQRFRLLPDGYVLGGSHPVWHQRFLQHLDFSQIFPSWCLQWLFSMWLCILEDWSHLWLLWGKGGDLFEKKQRKQNCLNHHSNTWTKYFGWNGIPSIFEFLRKMHLLPTWQVILIPHLPFISKRKLTSSIYFKVH